MNCPNSYRNCKSKDFKELAKSDGTDNIAGLKHSHMRCNSCGYQFNYWNESLERLQSVFGENYPTYKNA